MHESLKWFNTSVWRGVPRDLPSKGQAHRQLTIITRWVAVNKGGAIRPDIRARLVACELNTDADESGMFYAATPPLEDASMLVSEYATKRFQDGAPLQTPGLGITKAYVHGRQTRDLLCSFAKRAWLTLVHRRVPTKMHVREPGREANLGRDLRLIPQPDWLPKTCCVSVLCLQPCLQTEACRARRRFHGSRNKKRN